MITFNEYLNTSIDDQFQRLLDTTLKTIKQNTESSNSFFIYNINGNEAKITFGTHGEHTEKTIVELEGVFTIPVKIKIQKFIDKDLQNEEEKEFENIPEFIKFFTQIVGIKENKILLPEPQNNIGIIKEEIKEEQIFDGKINILLDMILEKFDDIKCKETDKYYAFNLSNVKSSKNLYLANLKFILFKEDLDSSNDIKYFYLTDPRKVNSIVETTSKFLDIVNDLEGIVLYNQLNESYIETIYINIEKSQSEVDVEDINKVIKERQLKYLREAFTSRVGATTVVSSSSAAGSGGSKGVKGVGYDQIGIDLEVY